MDWTDEALALVKDWRTNPQNTESARSLARRLGTTRSAVVGVAVRHGWEMVDKPGRKGHNSKTTRRRGDKNYGVSNINFSKRADKTRKAPTLKLPPKPAGEPESKHLSVIKIEHDQCRFIAGDDRQFCGQQTQRGSSYCPYHHALCWSRPEDRKKVAA